MSGCARCHPPQRHTLCGVCHCGSRLAGGCAGASSRLPPSARWRGSQCGHRPLPLNAARMCLGDETQLRVLRSDSRRSMSSELFSFVFPEMPRSPVPELVSAGQTRSSLVHSQFGSSHFGSSRSGSSGPAHQPCLNGAQAAPLPPTSVARHAVFTLGRLQRGGRRASFASRSSRSRSSERGASPAPLAMKAARCSVRDAPQRRRALRRLQGGSTN